MKCLFCGKTKREVLKMVASRITEEAICNECVVLCCELMLLGDKATKRRETAQKIVDAIGARDDGNQNDRNSRPAHVHTGDGDTPEPGDRG